MAHGTRISGTDKAVTAGLTRTGGVNMKITKGLTLVGGVQKEIPFISGEPAGNLAVGTSVYIPVSGVSTEFLVVHQGKPSDIYDDSCDGTWLLMKNIYETHIWHPYGKYANFDTANIHTHLNSTFLNRFDAGVRNLIKIAKIPYGDNFNRVVISGADGVESQLFLLSCYELGFTYSSSRPLYADGARLGYFNGGSRTATFNGRTYAWWTRSHNMNYSSRPAYIDTIGTVSFDSQDEEYGVRPAMILPQDATVDENFNIIV